MNIELYIKNRLCDIDSPESLGIRLKRQFINPAELSVKDAQMSYEISLPATPNNNEIFSHVNVEEVKGKFRIYEDARLYVDGILILNGKFRLSEITPDSYKGNLGVPAPLTVKDIFGETMMNQAGKWEIGFEGAPTITAFNKDEYDKKKYGEIAPCIFPFALYGLLNKTSSQGASTDKDVFDSSVRFRFEDIPPSVNCLRMLEQIFENAKYKLTGSAFDDERLKQLYVSYMNPNDFAMKWNTGKMELSGKWTNYDDKKRQVENRAYRDDTEEGKLQTINLFNAINTKVTPSSTYNIGGNITTNDNNVTTFTIPNKGLYKIILRAKVSLSKGSETVYYINGNSGPFVMEPDSPDKNNHFHSSRFELKLMRNFDGSLENIRFDNVFFNDNQRENAEEVGTAYPKPGETHFIDPKQNPDILCGFAWGKKPGLGSYINPTEERGQYIYNNPMAIKGGKSWDGEIEDRAYSASVNSGYLERTAGNGWKETNRFKVEIDNAPPSRTDIDANIKDADGEIAQVVWMEAGEKLSLIEISDMGLRIDMKYGDTQYGWLRHTVDFYLSVEPFMQEADWLTMRDDGASEKPMNWDDDSTFEQGNINLVEFMPQQVKINDWIDNFCKAFNLNMIHTGGVNFELNVKNKELVSGLSHIIDLDRRAGISRRRNESLKLPYVYELGFTIDTSEQGYYESMKDNEKKEKIVNSGDDGGGKFYTGSYETNKLSHTSDFSYNWLKTIKIEESGKELKIPVITEHEIWEKMPDYDEMKEKKYYEMPQRFWYKTETFDSIMNNGDNVTLACVGNEYTDNRKTRIVLNYKDEPDTITKNYFLLLADNNNDYTIIDCCLTSEEYRNLGKSLVKLNGDLYNIAEIDGYDPLGKNKCALKLIRKII
ncbi:hypothetical protein D0T84_16830 [Dysgonomonas sp. 521]|uniref:hypothetical protein n=1 Tax=Dysgonomonas sp. 521 TaxID=2302932 RepID=UPI0013D631DA|nr:hypothetical protein [Dysgonomonas sp. 521]NDV96567.1 hypothetical protein [Dysgonomonas sp. 521]